MFTAKLPDTILTMDTETTGVDVYNDRIVTCFVGLMDTKTGEFTQKIDWLLNPGVEIPDGAAEVHGITTEHAQRFGRTDIAAVLAQIVYIVGIEASKGTPLVIYNAPFDLTLLHSECVRHGVPPLDTTALDVIDPLVIDKGVDKYRKGSRKLVDAAPIYGVPVEENAHDAGADCLMTGRIVVSMMKSSKFTHLFSSAAGLRMKQIGWKHEQATSLQHYFRTKANPRQPDAIVNTGWPVYAPEQHEQAVAA